jgi:hypothetical protein
MKRLGLRREAQRHAAFGSRIRCESGVAACALPPQSKTAVQKAAKRLQIPLLALITQNMRNELTGSLRRVLVVSITAILMTAGLAVWYLSGRAYFIFETHGHGNSAIWNDDEAFIFLGNETSGLALKRYQMILQAVIGAFWYHVPAEKFREDLLVFHITRHSIHKYHLQNFGRGGGAFPFQGKLYFSRGGESADWPYVWLWTGTNFLRVGTEEALQIIEQFPPLGSLPHSVAEQTKREGWKEHSSLSFYSGKETRYPIHLGERSLVVVTKAESSGSETLVVQDAQSHDTLSILPGRYRQVSREDYMHMKNGKSSAPNQPAAQRRGRVSVGNRTAGSGVETAVPASPAMNNFG